MSQPDFIRALIRTGYLPAEIPPIVTTKTFADFAKNNYSAIAAQQSRLFGLSTRADIYSYPRSGAGRRNLALVHPLAQLGVSLVITKNRTAIRKTLERSSSSLFDLNEDRVSDRAYKSLDFDRWKAGLHPVASRYPYILFADISRFFYTAYTHSISWAVLGKSRTKELLRLKSKKLKRHWSSDLDKALQSCQERETFGIPVGPDTSRLIAELLLSGIDQDPRFRPAVQGRTYDRLLDDYRIGFETLDQARSALSALRRALWGFNLQLNDAKTAIKRSSEVYVEKWRDELAVFQFREVHEVGQRAEIGRLIDLAYRLCDESKVPGPAIFACRKLANAAIAPANLRIVLDGVLRMARDFPACVAQAGSFLINGQAVFDAVGKDRIHTWAKAILSTNSGHGYEHEAVWALVICAVLRLRLSKDDVNGFGETPSPIVLAMLGLMHEKGLLSFPLSVWPWRQRLKQSGAYGEYWLPLYESVRRKWTTDKKIIALVNADPIFQSMLSAGVTFLDDELLSATRIDVSRRVYKITEAIALPAGSQWLRLALLSNARRTYEDIVDDIVDEPETQEDAGPTSDFDDTTS